jgi:DNA-binding transcriptional LysR family regulator
MQGIKRKVVYITLYEVIAITMSTAGLALLSGAQMGHASVAAVAASAIAVVWNLVYNTLFERPGTDEREGFQELGQEILVAVISPAHPEAQARQGRLQLNDLIDIRQIAVVSRDPRGRDPRLLLSRHIWRTDSHLATLSLVQAGLGWAYLPRSLIAPMVAAGTLTEIRFNNISNELRVWVDVVWHTDRAMGLGAKRFIELMRQAASSAPA